MPMRARSACKAARQPTTAGERRPDGTARKRGLAAPAQPVAENALLRAENAQLKNELALAYGEQRRARRRA